MTNEEILRIAMEQSAVDANCLAEDFVKTETRLYIPKSGRTHGGIWNCRLHVILFPTGPILWRPSVKSMRGLSGIT